MRLEEATPQFAHAEPEVYGASSRARRSGKALKCLMAFVQAASFLVGEIEIFERLSQILVSSVAAS